MGEQVSVDSFEALSCLRMALAKFIEEAESVLYAADAHLQRTKTWVKTEQANYWKLEGRKRAELLLQAKLKLKTKKLTPTALDGRPSCVEEEQAVKLATHRMEEAEQKARNVSHWSRKIDEEGLAYSGAAAGMKQTCTLDVPTAIARLDHMLAALEAYVAGAAPRMQESVASTGAETDIGAAAGYESVARPTLPPSDEKVDIAQKSDQQTERSDQLDDQRDPP